MEKPKVSFGALSTLEGFDFSKLVVVLDISGSMSKHDVYVSIATYFRTLSTLSPSLARKPLQAILGGVWPNISSCNKVATPGTVTVLP